MRRCLRILSLLGVFVFAVSGVAFAQEKDKPGCKDHPMFTRMENFYIRDCREKEFDQADFYDEKGKEFKIEGKLHFAKYRIKEGFKAPSELQIIRNYQNAIKKIGGVVVYQFKDSATYLTLSKGGKTYWVIVDPSK